MRKLKKMPLHDFLRQLETAIEEISEEQFFEHLNPLIPADKLEGLHPVFQANMRDMIDKLRLLASR